MRRRGRPMAALALTDVETKALERWAREWEHTWIQAGGGGDGLRDVLDPRHQ
jgi:hypothetical protein